MDDDIGKAGYGNPDPELAVVIIGQEVSVFIKDLGGGRRPVMFQGGNIGQPGEHDGNPDDNDKANESEGPEAVEKILFHGAVLFFLLIGFLVRMFIPSTERTGLIASAPADAFIKPDDRKHHDNQNDR
jgi:hypothetical protein